MIPDVLRVRAVEARLVAHDWGWARTAADAIEANWRRRLAQTPEIFNGPVLVIASMVRTGDRLDATFFRTDYRHLLANLDLGGDGIVKNGFAMGVLRGSCGGCILGEMASHTANAGRLYFPAGTPDPDDVTADGRVDLTASILREVEEETGLAGDLGRLGDHWDVVTRDGRTAFLRAIHLPIPADEAAERIRAHLATEEKPELAAIHVVRRPDEIDAARMPTFLPGYLRELLDDGPDA